MQRYRLIFDGHLQPQASREEVQRQLADLFQVSPEQVETLFSKPRWFSKRTWIMIPL